MPYLAHSVHAQLGALPLGLVGWTLLAVSVGLVQWRVWILSFFSTEPSGVAWIGIWRACFYSQEQASPGLLIMHCSSINLQDSFTPPEIATAQISMFLSLGFGILGFVCGIYALRNAFFGIKSLTQCAFCLGGTLTLLAAILALIPLLWNLAAVLRNQPIQFPDEFKLPETPKAQQVGGAVWAGLLGVVLLAITAIIDISYKLPKEEMRSLRKRQGRNNPAFEFDDVWL
ncbi:claudin-34-like [Periophthalmus magnuspinnatus]|uniref:claudin-34-like n=1 Tax=Periophthalmus magnuspinnatus TaxID=409849 RepID=UPI00145BDC8C|nr:claudin-34-like [Periophthalmus magnuspinnatus]